MTGESAAGALVDAARAGDAGAVEELLRRVQPRLLRFGMRMCGDPEDAKDVLQDTLLAALRALPEFAGRSSLDTWLYAIARSQCVRRRRRSKFAPPRELSLHDEAAALELPDPARGAEQQVDDRRLARALDRAIAALPPAQREVLLLRDVEGLTAPEVGAALGLTIEAVKSRLHRARAQVRRDLAPLLDGKAARRRPGCPNVVDLLSRHLEGDISRSACAAMERHVAECPSCRDACETLRATLRLCHSVPEPLVPGPIQEAVRRELRSALAPRP